MATRELSTAAAFVHITEICPLDTALLGLAGDTPKSGEPDLEPDCELKEQ
jgi:hypothetical protein